jgi:putative endonuclease
MKQYDVYILTNRWRTVLYVGMTSNIEQRVFQHKTKFFKKAFTGRYNVDRLVYMETYRSVWDAIAREKELKRWRREWKENLINKDNPKWEDLSGSWYDERDIVKAKGIS